MIETSDRDVFLETSPEIARLQAMVDDYARERGPLRVLEAGCGSASYIDVGEDAHVTGIDISPAQLERHPGLDLRIRGDIQTYRFPRPEFDVIVCWDVLEHLPRPTDAVANLARALKRDGILVLALPNLLSAKGLVTKFTPHRFHVWFYRAFFGWARAGEDDRGPFKTYFRWSIAPAALRRFAERHALRVEYFAAYESWSQKRVRRRLRVTGRVWSVVRRLVKGLTLGKVTPELTDYIMVLRKA